jgi:hypothetical protein
MMEEVHKVSEFGYQYTFSELYRIVLMLVYSLQKSGVANFSGAVVSTQCKIAFPSVLNISHIEKHFI